MIGRAAPLATIAATRRGETVLVAADPGVGLSTLLDEAARRFAATGVVVRRVTGADPDGPAYDLADHYVRRST